MAINLNRLSAQNPKTGSANNKLNSIVRWLTTATTTITAPTTTITSSESSNMKIRWGKSSKRQFGINQIVKMLDFGQLIKNKLKLLKCYECNYKRSCPELTPTPRGTTSTTTSTTMFAAHSNFCKRFLCQLTFDWWLSLFRSVSSSPSPSLCLHFLTNASWICDAAEPNWSGFASHAAQQCSNSENSCGYAVVVRAHHVVALTADPLR